MTCRPNWFVTNLTARFSRKAKNDSIDRQLSPVLFNVVSVRGFGGVSPRCRWAEGGTHDKEVPRVQGSPDASGALNTGVFCFGAAGAEARGPTGSTTGNRVQNSSRGGAEGQSDQAHAGVNR